MQAVKTNADLTPLERLTFYAEQISRIHSQRPFLSRFMISESVNPTEYGWPIIEKHLSQVYQFLHKSLQEGIAHGDFQPDLNVNFAAISLAGILNFYFIAKPLIENVTDLSKDANSAYTAHAFHIYLHGIMKQK